MNTDNKTRLLLSSMLILCSTSIVTTPLNATPLAIWDSSWIQIANDDGVGPNGFVDPGWGGQVFDAEYLYYKVEGNFLSIGLQSGFDLQDGHQTYANKSYWAGDLALSFDGNVNLGGTAATMANSYEFGIDFGLYTADYNSHNVDAVANSNDSLGAGIDQAGVYSVGNGQWNTNMVDQFEAISSPYAMNQGWDGTGTNPYLTALILNESGTDGTSFYRYVKFDLTQLGLASLNDITMDAHWTMSCGNDVINGRSDFSVPEPGVLVLLATGLIGTLVTTSLKRRKNV